MQLSVTTTAAKPLPVDLMPEALSPAFPPFVSRRCVRTLTTHQERGLSGGRLMGGITRVCRGAGQ